MKITLRHINENIRELTDALADAADSAEVDALMKELDALSLQREQKLENIAYVRLEQKSLCQTIDAEIKRLEARKKAIASAGKRLDLYVLDEMSRAGLKTHKGPLASITVAKSPVSCEIIDEAAVPAAYLKTETVTKILKADAIRHYKETGEILPGMAFGQRDHVRIK